MSVLSMGMLVPGSKSFTLPHDAIAETFAFLGIRGSGKTSSAIVMAEEMCRAGLPWIAIDPVGVWWGMRAKPDGKPSDFPVVVFGGLKGDLPIDKNAGRKIAEAVIAEQVFAVIDLSQESKRTWRKFVTDFSLALMDLNPALPRHIFIEEAPEFLPQRTKVAITAECKEAVERLVRLGRNRGYGASLISQRPATVDKDALSVAPWMRAPIKAKVNGGLGTSLRTMEEIWELAGHRSMVGKATTLAGLDYEYIELPKRPTAELKTVCFKNGIGWWAPIRKVIRHYYKGNLIRLSQKWGEVVVTPNHSVYAADGSLARPQDNPELLAVRSINQQHTRDINAVTLRLPDSNFISNGDVFKPRLKGKGNPHEWTMKLRYTGDDLKSLLRVMGAYISEGSVHWRNNSKRHPESRGSGVVQIANTDRPWLEGIMADLKTFAQPATHIYEASKSPIRTMPCWNLTTSNRSFAAWLDKNCGRGSYHKRLPDFVYDLKWEYVEELLDAMIKGDGSRFANGSWGYFTTSQELAQGLGLLLSMHGKGYVVSKNEKTNVYQIRKCDWYNHRDSEIRRMEEIPFDGYVYDLEIDDRYSHNFVIGVGNVVVHNSQTGSLFVLRTIGAHDRKALKEWLGEKQVNDESFLTKLDSLENGEGFFWSPAWLKRFDHVKIRPRETYHPGATRKVGSEIKAVTMSDVKSFVDKVKRQFSRVSVPVAKLPAMDPAFEPASRTQIESITNRPEYLAVVEENTRLKAELETALKRAQNADMAFRRASTAEMKLAAVRKLLEPQYDVLKTVFEEVSAVSGNGHADRMVYEPWLQKAGRGTRHRMLQVMIEKRELSRAQLSTLANCSIRSSGFKNNLSWLNVNKLVDVDREMVRLTKV